MAFTALLQSMPWADRVHLHVDGEGPLDMAQLLGAPQAGLHLYVCGPRGFMDAALGHARASGWSEDSLHYEFFAGEAVQREGDAGFEIEIASTDRKSTRLNSSHLVISYAVFCLKKKKKTIRIKCDRKKIQRMVEKTL